MLGLKWVNAEMIMVVIILRWKEKLLYHKKSLQTILYVRDKVNDLYSHAADIRSVSEDVAY